MKYRWKPWKKKKANWIGSPVPKVTSLWLWPIWDFRSPLLCSPLALLQPQTPNDQLWRVDSSQWGTPRTHLHSHLWGSGRKQLDLGLWAAWDLGKCGHSYNGNELKKVAEWKMWKVFGGCIWPVFLEQMVCSREYWSKAGKGVRSSMNKASGCHAKDWTWGLSDPKMSMAVQSWTSLILFDLGN